MATETEQSTRFGRQNLWRKTAQSAVQVVAALWMAGGTVFFLVRFGSVFYRANQFAIDKMLEKLTGGG